MTGTGEAVIFSMMSRVELTRPPGVLVSISTAWAFLACASAMARPMYSSVVGWIVSFRTIFSTSADEGVGRISRVKSPAAYRATRTTNDDFISGAVAALSARAGLRQLYCLANRARGEHRKQASERSARQGSHRSITRCWLEPSRPHPMQRSIVSDACPTTQEVSCFQ